MNLKDFDVQKEDENVTKDSKEIITVTNKCPLCLNIRKNTSVTPCGHLFCWSCIISWLQSQAKCPLCRQSVQPWRVVFIRNYRN